jgi:hypothetical protein
MNVPLLLAGVTSFAGAAIHGIVGDVLLVRRIDSGSLPSTRFGGPAASKFLIRVSWHLLTATFVVLGAAMFVCGLFVCGFDDAHDACRSTAILSASAFSAFAAITIASSVRMSGTQGLFRHPAPAAFTVIAVLAWWGAL